MLVPTLLEHGSEEQKQRWIGPTIRGEVIWCQGYSEPGAGSDLANVQTRAVEDGDDFVINGQKIWTTTAHLAAHDVRPGPHRARRRASTAGSRYLLIPMDTPGIEVRPLGTMTGRRRVQRGVLHATCACRRRTWSASAARAGRSPTPRSSTSATCWRRPARSSPRSARLVELMQAETRDGRRAIDDPVLRDRLLRLAGARARDEVPLAAHAHLLAQAGAAAGARHAGGLRGAGHQALGLRALASDRGARDRRDGRARRPLRRLEARARSGAWQFQYMFSLGLIIGGGTAQIQKNIIARARARHAARARRAAGEEPR